jgi:MFS family permease
MRIAAAARSRKARDWSYGLALFGAHLSFMPLLVLLLPRRVEALASGNAATALSQILLIGALVASVANIGAGNLSDRWMRRHGNRRVPIALGVALTLASYIWLAAAGSLPALTAAVIVFQLSVNGMLSPLAALLTDHFPHHEKGRISGLANAALPLSSAAVAPLVWLFPGDHPGAFLLTGTLAVACIAPLVVIWPFAGPASQLPAPALPASDPVSSRRRDFALAWIARFIVQLGAAFIIGYLYVFVGTHSSQAGSADEAETARRIAALALFATLFATLSALACGRLSDRLRRRRVPLAIAAICAGLALAILGSDPGWVVFLAAYALFHAGLAGFLAIDTALVAEMVTANGRRAALLGIMNLTNTLPSVLAPGIALIVLRYNPQVGSLFWALTMCAFGCALAALAVLCIRGVR